MESWFVLGYLIGVPGSWFTYYYRAGLAEIKAQEGIDWREFGIPNIGFFVLMFAKMWTWPGVFVLWLVSGRRASPWSATTVVDEREARSIRRVRPDT